MINFKIENNKIKFYDRRQRKDVGVIRANGIVSFNERTCIKEILAMNEPNNVKLALIQACQSQFSDVVRVFEYELESTFKEIEQELSAEMDIIICKTVSVNEVRNSASLLAKTMKANVRTSGELRELYNSLNYNGKKKLMFDLYGSDFARQTLQNRANKLMENKIPEVELKTIATFSKYFGFSL